MTEPSFVKVSQRVSELWTQTVGLTLEWSQFTKGHYSIKAVDGLYICTKFQENVTIIEQM